MPEIISTDVAHYRQKLDRQLLLSLALSPLAAGISTIVGYTVAHWIAIVGYKRHRLRRRRLAASPCARQLHGLPGTLNDQLT